jgi:hypothetical protein
MAFGTACYGFGALWIAFRIARRYFDERWAFLAALGIWFGSSLAVYMYFNPSWSHAPSAFIVALFVWYWLRTRESRSLREWLILGALGGLMMDVYYINAVVLWLPMCDVIAEYWAAARTGKGSARRRDIFRGAAHRISADADYQENYLWQLFNFWLFGPLAVEFAGIFEGFGVEGSWVGGLDASAGIGDARFGVAGAARP